MVTESIPLNREKDGKLYRSALEEDPTVLAGNYEAVYNTMYSGETAEAATVEYSLGSDFFHISLSAAQTARKSLIKQQQFVKNQTTQYFDLFFN